MFLCACVLDIQQTVVIFNADENTGNGLTTGPLFSGFAWVCVL